VDNFKTYCLKNIEVSRMGRQTVHYQKHKSLRFTIKGMQDFAQVEQINISTLKYAVTRDFGAGSGWDLTQPKAPC
jgi:hypothetical protein